MTKKIKPELWIYYSWIYDRCIHEWRRLEYKDFFDKGMKYRDKLQKKWDKIERKVFDTISKVSGLEWHKPIIDCYVVRNVIPFSMPLTISIKNNFDEQVENIIHELIHNIVVQNHDKIKRKDYSKKYGTLNKTTKIHILIHAILKETLLKIYGERKTKEFIKRYNKWSDYKKAWEVVERESSKKIIRDLIIRK